MDSIYLVTTVRIVTHWHHLTQHRITKISHKRTVGWFYTLKRAEEVVMDNEGDIYEHGRYNHCIIEKMPLGLYPHIGLELWFEWKRGRYVVITKPRDLGDIHNLGIG